MILNLWTENGKLWFKNQNYLKYYTEVLKYNLCDYHDAYILVRGDITVNLLLM